METLKKLRQFIELQEHYSDKVNFKTFRKIYDRVYEREHSEGEYAVHAALEEEIDYIFDIISSIKKDNEI